MYSFDIKSDRIDYTKRILKDLELGSVCEIICSDAKRCSIKEDIVFLFIDGLKEEYFDYLKSFEDKLIEGSLVLAHNTISHPYKMANYIKEVYSKFLSLTIMTDPGGITLSTKFMK